MTETVFLKGSLTIDGGAPAQSNCVPTPRFDGENCFLPARQRYYDATEVSLHSPNRPEIEPKEYGPMCRCCGRRNTERMGKNLYRCQHTGETGELHIRDGFPVLLPLRQVEK
jgi:hypothetical protein